MKHWIATFTGREVGAIGAFSPFTVAVEGDDEDAAKLALYKTHEHISNLALSETFVDAESGQWYYHDHATGCAERVPDELVPDEGPEEPQTWRIEIRFDFTGTKVDAQQRGQDAALSLMREGAHGAEVTAIFDENWNEVE